MGGLSKFQKAIAGKALPAALDGDAREAWNTRWQRKIYPLWQTPIALLAGERGIANVLSRLHHPTPGLLNYDELVVGLHGVAWDFGADVYVQTADGLPDAFVLYLFGGNGMSGTILRVGVTVDQAAVADISTAKAWTGEIADIVKRAVDDVPAAAALVEPLLIAAIRQRDERIAAEKAAEEKRAKDEAEQLAKKSEADRLEAAKAAEDAEREAKATEERAAAARAAIGDE